MRDQVVSIYQVNGQFEAEMIKSYLEANGIPCGISQESAGISYGITVGALGKVDILVNEKYQEQALQLIQAYADNREQDSD